MKSLLLFLIALAMILSEGCAYMPTTVKVRVLEHKQDPQGHYALLCEVIDPPSIAGRYHIAGTLRRDLIPNVDGGEYEVSMNHTMIAQLQGGGSRTRPREYQTSRPSGGDGDFLDSAKRLK